jgi:SAM-dependent methyltransferase
MADITDINSESWRMRKHPMADWIAKIAHRSGIDTTVVVQVMEAAIASGIAIELPEPAEGFHITRYVMYRRINTFFQSGRHNGQVLEVSGEKGAIYSMFDPNEIECISTCYPDIDVQSLPYLDNTFDYAICDQVIEHIPEPQQAVNELRRVLKPGGWLFLASAFLDPIHTYPENVSDFWRFTPEGLRYLIRDYSRIYQCEGWGNREAFTTVMYGGLQKYLPVSGHPELERISSYNEPTYPLSVWAIAQK